MTNLKIDIKFNSSCILTIKDVTGFQGGLITQGFIPETGTATLESQYKITDGFFFNAILYHKYGGDLKLLNPKEEYVKKTSLNASLIYADNFLTKHYTLTVDGVYSFKRLFVISKDYYLANLNVITKTVIYYDDIEDEFVKVTSGESKIIRLIDVINDMGPTTTGSTTTYKFVSTCYLNRCLYLLQNEIINQGVINCNTKNDIYKKERDYIFMTLNIIDYLKQDGHLTQVQKIIEAANSCGVICTKIAAQYNTDCGCG